MPFTETLTSNIKFFLHTYAIWPPQKSQASIHPVFSSFIVFCPLLFRWKIRLPLVRRSERRLKVGLFVRNSCPNASRSFAFRLPGRICLFGRDFWVEAILLFGRNLLPNQGWNGVEMGLLLFSPEKFGGAAQSRKLARGTFLPFPRIERGFRCSISHFWPGHRTLP